MTNNSDSNQRGIKSGPRGKAVTVAAVAVLFGSFFAGSLIMPAMAANDTSVNATAGITPGAGGAGINAGANIKADNGAKHLARQTLRQALQQDAQAYKQAVGGADLAYKQASQDASVAHSQAVQNANLAYNQAVQQARNAYNDAVRGSHGNATLTGQAMATRDQAINAAETAKINAIMSADVTHDKTVYGAWYSHQTTVYTALATRDGADASARAAFYTALGNSTDATRAQAIGTAHVTADDSILKARQARIDSAGNATVTKDQAVGTAQTTYANAEGSARITLDNGYTRDAKTWNTDLQTYYTTVAPLIQTEDSSIAQANAALTTAMGGAASARDQAIDQAYATMYGSIAAAYS